MTAVDFKFTDSQTKPSQKMGYCKFHKKNFFKHSSYHVFYLHFWKIIQVYSCNQIKQGGGAF